MAPLCDVGAVTTRRVFAVRRQTGATPRGLALPVRGGGIIEDAGFTENRNDRAELSRRYRSAAVPHMVVSFADPNAGNPAAAQCPDATPERPPARVSSEKHLRHPEGYLLQSET